MGHDGRTTAARSEWTVVGPEGAATPLATYIRIPITRLVRTLSMGLGMLWSLVSSVTAAAGLESAA